MKKTLLLLWLFPACNFLFAQEYQTLQTTGFNADVIANGIGSSAVSTSMAMDNADYVLMSADFQLLATDTPPSFALPVSGQINNAAMPGLSYQLAPYSLSNSLRLQEQSEFGALSFSNPVSATTLYVLAATGSGSATLGGTIHFSDNTTQDAVAGVIPDWFFSNALPVVISGFGRVSRTTDIIENPIGDPRLYQFEIAILPENQTKTITGIDFTKTSAAEGVLNIFAISAKLLGTCPAPSSLVASNISNVSADISWTFAVIPPASGYDYYLTTSASVPAASQAPTGNVANNLVSLTGLTIGQHYCVWVRSHCSAIETGEWVSTCFTTGQQTTAYTGSDIPTLYNLTPDLSSVDSCPGMLTVNVPAGYQISGVGTSYDMQTALNGWMSEQRSLLVCITTSTAEPAVVSGVGGTTGTYHYERSGLNLANGATGAVDFELRAWRAYGGSDCNVDYNRVLGNSWTVTVTLQSILNKRDVIRQEFLVYPNPAENFVHISGEVLISKIQIFNLLGQEVLQSETKSKTPDIDISALATGKYLMKITSEKGIETKGIIKK